MIGKFNLYDFLANLLPGLLFLFCFEQIVVPIGIKFPITFTGGIAETSVLILLGYLTGLFIQALSERFTEPALKRLWCGFPSARWLLPTDGTFSEPYKRRLRELIVQRFGVPTDLLERQSTGTAKDEALKKKQELFYLCYNYVEQRKLSDRPLIFNAQYGLFRGLLTTFLILLILATCLLGHFWIHDWSKNAFSFFATFSLLPLTWLSYVRCRKRGEDFARAVYDLFLSSPDTQVSK